MPSPSIAEPSRKPVKPNGSALTCERTDNSLIRIGLVTDVFSSGTATVELASITACHRCASRGGCGVQLLPTAPLTLACRNPCDAETGQQVAVQLPTPVSGWLRPVWQSYGVLIFTLLVGLVAGYLISRQMATGEAPWHLDLMTFIGGLTGLALGSTLTRYFGQKESENGRGLATSEARIVTVVTGDST